MIWKQNEFPTTVNTEQKRQCSDCHFNVAVTMLDASNLADSSFAAPVGNFHTVKQILQIHINVSAVHYINT